MADPKGFLKHNRELPSTRDPKIRVGDYKEIYQDFGIEKTEQQAARCMDCGIPFCHNGCPLGNIIPEFNDAVYRNSWEEATQILLSTNNFPEFTGRICPAPCESACVLGINQPPVAIEHIEKTIAEVAFEKGFIRPNPPSVRTNKKVAVIGSGPAGLAAAAQLNKAGHLVTVYEREDRIGGLLRYGIPDFKLEKWTIDRRLRIMEAEGIKFMTKINVGSDLSTRDLLHSYDAVVLCGGSTIPRDINIPGRDLSGVHFAMDFLTPNNKAVAGDSLAEGLFISAEGKDVIVIGGGDTGADCVGTSHRHGARSVTQLEIMPQPPQTRDMENPWPLWPLILRTSSSHEEGGKREWSVLTKEFVGDDQGNLQGLKIAEIAWAKDAETGRMSFQEVPNTERQLPCQRAFIAAGFLHPQYTGLLEEMNLGMTDRGNVQDDGYRTSLEKVFVAGDMRRGQSLVVWALMEGREAAKAVDRYLRDDGESTLEGKMDSALYLG